MKNVLIIVLISTLLVSIPLIAQDKQKDDEKKTTQSQPSMEPPKPLGKDLTWMVGEWEGWAESPMGKTKEWQKVELMLNDQFLVITATSEMNDMKYTGLGAITQDIKTGEIVGYWIDNWRGMYNGKGTIEGNISTMKWVGTDGESTRVMEKIDDDKFTVKITAMSPDGKPMEAKSEMMRKKVE